MSSEVFITKSFHPTFLYIKQHSITGKMYFGKTIKNPEKYFGSGTHWKNHIKKHGKDHVVTLWYCLFYDRESCTEFALMFSKQQNIVESDVWLNQTVETGLGGTSKGHLKGKFKGKLNPNFGKTWSIEQKESFSNKIKGRNKGLSYEIIYGEELASTLKIKRAIQMSTSRKGKTTVKDKSGNKFTVNCDDSRLLSGELKGVGVGRKFDNHKVYICPHCNKEGRSSSMFRWHFDNCKLSCTV